MIWDTIFINVLIGNPHSIELITDYLGQPVTSILGTRPLILYTSGGRLGELIRFYNLIEFYICPTYNLGNKN